MFFNRGVASSQYYVREFGTGPIDELEEADRARAFAWLSRDLDDAAPEVHRRLPAGATGCSGCFYEFHYEPAVAAFARAIRRGVDVRLIVDAKENQHREEGKLVPAFPREANLARHPAGRHPDEPGGASGGPQVGHLAQQVHGPGPQGPARERGVDRLHQPVPRRRLRPDQRRPLGPRPRRRGGVPQVLDAAVRGPRRPQRRTGRPRPRTRVQGRRRGPLAGQGAGLRRAAARRDPGLQPAAGPGPARPLHQGSGRAEAAGLHHPGLRCRGRGSRPRSRTTRRPGRWSSCCWRRRTCPNPKRQAARNSSG